MQNEFDLSQPLMPAAAWSLLDEQGQRLFLNHGSFGATPREVLRAQQEWRMRVERDPDQFYDDDLQELWLEQRNHVADFVRAARDDVVLVPNATFGTSSVFQSLPWQAGDEVVCTNQIYASVRAHLQVLASKGVVLRTVTVPTPLTHHDEIVQAFASLLTRRTKLLVIDHITSPTALLMPIESVIQMARDHGCLVYVDGAHAPGQVPLHLGRWKPDFYVGNCHKWLFAPKTAAFLYVRSPWRDQIRPAAVGNFYGDGFTSAFAWLGTADATASLCIAEGIQFWHKLGGAKLERRNHLLVRYGREKVLSALRLDAPCPNDANYYAAMSAVPLATKHPVSRSTAHEWRQVFRRDHRVNVNFSVVDQKLWVRFCAQAYNRSSDYDRLAEALGQTVF